MNKFFTQYSLILLCETWLKPSNLYELSLEGYKCINKSRARSNLKAKRGLDGLLCYIYDSIKEGIVHLSGIKTSEDRIWFKLNSLFFGFPKDLYLCFVYISPAESTHLASRENLWNMLEEEIAYFQDKGHILLLGDFTAWTANNLDYRLYRTRFKWLCSPSLRLYSRLSLNRVSQDNKLNNYGKILL